MEQDAMEDIICTHPEEERVPFFYLDSIDSPIGNSIILLKCQIA